MPVPVLQNAITSRHLTECMIYYGNYGTPKERLEYYLAQIAYWVYRTNQDKFEGSTPLTIDDFVFKFGQEADEKSNEQDMLTKMKIFAGVGLE